MTYEEKRQLLAAAALIERVEDLERRVAQLEQRPRRGRPPKVRHETD